MEFELRELGQTAGLKVVKIVVANVVILGLTFLGYKYLPDILNWNLQGSGKLIAVVAIGPAMALISTIQIGVRQQRIFVVGADGIKFGDSISGVQYCSWEDICCFNLSHDTKKLQLVSETMDIAEIIPLKKFGINELQYNRLLELSSACKMK